MLQDDDIFKGLNYGYISHRGARSASRDRQRERLEERIAADNGCCYPGARQNGFEIAA